MEPHKDILNEMIPPKKHLLRYQPANAQIGLMVCTELLKPPINWDQLTVCKRTG